ncbi:MAG TPA: alpha/beta hydrolase [Flavisolibacter sp.]|nr:alpha/beta hydrolase [Flavisolibacter sp.]
MRNLLFILSFVLVTSCQKESTEVPVQPLEAKTIMNVAYGADVQQKMDVYLPANRHSDSTKLMILVHGGAWIEGDKSDFDLLVATWKQRLPNYAIANINYRLATVSAHHFPTQEADLKSAIEFLVQRRGEYQVSQTIVLFGASAGAHMSLLQAYKNPSPKISAVVDLFGPTDMVALWGSITDPLNQYAMQILMGGTPTTNPAMYQQSSPINFVTAQSPPTILLHGEKDDLVNIQQSRDLKNKLQSFAVPHELVTYPDAGHGDWSPAIFADAATRVEAFLRKHVP